MLCKNCKFINLYDKISSCTIDEKERHHSYDDEPSIIYKNCDKFWHKHGDYHRENGPSIIDNDGFLYWYYENKYIIRTYNIPINNTIYIDETDSLYYPKHKKYYNKIAIILKQMIDYDPNVYFCLIDNDKRYIKCAI